MGKTKKDISIFMGKIGKIGGQARFKKLGKKGMSKLAKLRWSKEK